MPRRNAIPIVTAGWEQAVAASCPALAYSGKDAVAGALRHLKADRGSRLLLDDQRPAPHHPASQHVAHPQPNEIAAAELVVDRKVEEGKVARPSLMLEMKSDRLDLLRLQSQLGADEMVFIPNPVRGGILAGRGHSPSPASPIRLGSAGGSRKRLNVCHWWKADVDGTRMFA